MNRARQPAPHPRAIATSGTFQSTLYRASRQTLALWGLTGDWASSSHTGNRADYLPHIIEKVYMRTMNLNTVLEFSSTSIHQAAGQVETTADAAWWTLRPSRSLQLCVCIYIMFSPCSHPVPQGVYISSPKISTRHNHCPTTSQAAPPPLPGEQKTAKRLRVTQNDLYDDPRSAHSINPTDDVHNFRRNRGDVRNAPWFREPIKGLTSQSQRPDLFSHEWWDRSIATNRRSLKQPLERENLGFNRERHLDYDHVSLWYHRHRN